MAEEEDGTAQFEFEGDMYETPEIDHMTIGELSTMKRLTGGMSQRQWAGGLQELDPDVYCALFYVAVSRVKPGVTMEQIQAIELFPQIMRNEDGSEKLPVPPTEETVQVSEEEGTG